MRHVWSCLMLEFQKLTGEQTDGRRDRACGRRKEAFAVPFRILRRKSDRKQRLVLELVPFRDETISGHAINKILVPLDGSFQNFRRALSSFLYWRHPRGTIPC